MPLPLPLPYLAVSAGSFSFAWRFVVCENAHREEMLGPLGRPSGLAARPGRVMFDPYHRWLGIPRDQRPPTYYQLLGIAADETDAEVIQEAALRQTSHVRLYQTGPYAAQATTILNEIGQARAVLLNPEK